MAQSVPIFSVESATGGGSEALDGIPMRGGANLGYVEGTLGYVRSSYTYYVWDATSTATADGVLVIRPTNIAAASPGRWLYNALGKSETVVILEASDLPAPVANVITLSPVCYEIQGTVMLPAGVSLARPEGCRITGRSQYGDSLVGDVAGGLIRDVLGSGTRTLERLAVTNANVAGDVHSIIGGTAEVLIHDGVIYAGGGVGSHIEGCGAIIYQNSGWQGVLGGILMGPGTIGSVVVATNQFSSPGVNWDVDPLTVVGELSWTEASVDNGALINAAGDFLAPGGRGLVSNIAVIGAATVTTGGIEKIPAWFFQSNIGMPNSAHTINAFFNGSSAYTFRGTTFGFDTIPSILAVPGAADPAAPQRFILDPANQEYVEYTGLDPALVNPQAIISAATGGTTITLALKLQLDPLGDGTWGDITGSESTGRVESGSFASGQITSQSRGISIEPGARIRAVVGRVDGAGDIAGTIFSLSFTVS